MKQLIWKSTSTLVSNLKNAMKAAPEEKAVCIVVDGKSPTHDLLALGKLTAFIFTLRQVHGFTVTLEIINSGKPNAKYLALDRLGFFKLLAEFGVTVSVTHPSSTTKSIINQSNTLHEDIFNAISGPANYTQIIFPLTYFPFDKNNHINDCDVIQNTPIAASERLRWVERKTDEIITQIIEKITVYTKNHVSIKPEISKNVFPIIRELLQNCLQHSESGLDDTIVNRKNGFLLAITMTRAGIAANYRPGSQLEGWEDKLDLLVQDFGQGVLQSVRNTLDPNKNINPKISSSNLVANNVSTISSLWGIGSDLKDKEDSEREKHLLQTMFRGNLVVRRGRKSLGLQSIARHCISQNACLNFHSGYTELLLGGKGGAAHIEIRSKRGGSVYRIPGVIVAIQIPIHGMKIARSEYQLEEIQRKRKGKSERELFEGASIDEEILQAPKLSLSSAAPKGLFGGLSRITSTRRSETDAVRLLSSRSKDAIQVIDLKGSGAIDINFLDSLIQELCKSNRGTDSKGRSAPLSKIVFINVPRFVLSALRGKNCSAFLAERHQICLMLDEHDLPHFLGAMRMMDWALEFEELLHLIYMSAGTGIAESELKETKFKDEILEHAKSVFLEVNDLPSVDKNHLPILFRYKNDNEWHFIFRPVYESLLEQNSSAKSILFKKYCSIIKSGFLRMHNGQLIDRYFDFPRFFSHWPQQNEPETLLSCVKLLLEKSNFPFATHVVGLKGNGNMLASSVRDHIGAPNLILLEIPTHSTSGKIPNLNEQFKKEMEQGFPLLVLDTLLPGDWQHGGGGNSSFIAYLISSYPKLKVIALLGDPDATPSEFKDRFVSLWPLRSTSDPSQITKYAENEIDTVYAPKHVPIDKQIYTFDQIDQLGTSHQSYKSPLKSQSHLKFGPLELSTEFWQNVAELQIISASSLGKETRRLLFIEDNDAVISHPRLREQLQEFVENFIKNILELRLEIILVPNHPIGELLSHLVAKVLPSPPLIMPLSQWKYGGPIQVSSSEFESLQAQIRGYRKKRASVLDGGRRAHSSSNELESTSAESSTDESNADILKRPRCLVIDDSIVTGNSIFTMLGLASQLDLNPVGVMVLINRLTPEISETISLMPLSFGYFLRFHIPKLEEQEDPTAKILALDANVRELNASSFSDYWSATHFNKANSESKNHLLKNLLQIKPSAPQIAVSANLHNLIKDPVALQILQRLVLHPEHETIDFTTRLAIIFNFRDRIFTADKNFEFLKLLSEHGSNLAENPSVLEVHDQYSQTNQLLRKTIFLLAFSKTALRASDIVVLVEFCSSRAHFYLAENRWIKYPTVLCEILMALGALRSSTLFECLRSVLESKIIEIASQAYNHEFETDIPREQLHARSICAALAWSCGALAWGIESTLTHFDHECSIELPENLLLHLKNDAASLDERFFLLESLFPLIRHEPVLQQKLGLENLTMRATLEALADKESKEWKYLTSSPGYTISLRILLKIFDAESVLLIAWTDPVNFEEPSYYIKGFESTIKDAIPNPDCLEGLPKLLESRRKNHLYVTATAIDDGTIDMRISSPTNDSHKDTDAKPPRKPLKVKQYVGLPIEQTDGVHHYLVLTFNAEKSAQNLQSSFFFWLCYRSNFREILDAIQLKYVKSAITSNLLLTSSLIVHDDPESKLTVRRKLLRKMKSYIPVGKLLSQIVNDVKHRPLTLTEVGHLIRDESQELNMLAVAEWKNDKGGTSDNPLHIHGNSPIELRPFEGELSINFSTPLVKFILSECLCNALSFYQTRIAIKITYESVPVPTLQILISNDINKTEEIKHLELRNGARGSGITHCKSAANSQRALFTSERIKDKEGRELGHEAILKIRVYEVPDSLDIFLPNK